MIILLIFLFIYGVIIFSLTVALRKLGVSRHIVLFASFTLFGILSGFLVALFGPGEGSTYYDVFGALLGYEIYDYAIDHFGDPHSSFAHFTIPWVLRIPQVHLFASAILWSFIGLIAQLIYNWVREVKL